MLEATDYADLARPFSEESIETRTKGGTQLSYISHAVVTRRILDSDPNFTLEPAFHGTNGLPVEDRDENGVPVGFWVRLTIKGTAKLGYGSYTPAIKADKLARIQDPNQPDRWNDSLDPDWRKKVLSDGLSTAAMRFGIALQLWDKTVDNSTGESLRKAPTPLSPTLQAVKDIFNGSPTDVKEEIKTKYLNGRKFTDLSEDELLVIKHAYEPF